MKDIILEIIGGIFIWTLFAATMFIGCFAFD